MRYQKKRVMAQHAKNISNRTYGKRKFDVKKHKRNLKRRREKLEGNKKSTGDWVSGICDFNLSACTQSKNKNWKLKLEIFHTMIPDIFQLSRASTV